MNPVPFGKYTLLQKIGTGGMAELFLAKQEGWKVLRKPSPLKEFFPI